MFRKRHPPAGSRPGTLVPSEDAPPPRITVLRYNAAEIESFRVENLDSLSDHAAWEGVTWIDVQGLGDTDLLRRIASLFSIHALALEDVVNAPQRPKTEAYDENQLYISRMVHAGDATVSLEQVSIFVGRHYVLTFQERYGDVFDPVRTRAAQAVGPLRRSGPDYLAYALIDTIIDHYYPAVEQLTAQLEALEEEVLRRPDQHTLGAINRMRHTLLDLRRGIWPQRESVGALLRGDSPFITPPVQLYLRDTYDHIVQVTEIIEMNRELCTGLFNTYLSMVGIRTNDVMKVLTIMASIFIPLTFMAGIYGMNFDAMPELHFRWAYPALLLSMALVAIGMLWFFRRRGWLGGSAGEDRPERDDDA